MTLHDWSRGLTKWSTLWVGVVLLGFVGSSPAQAATNPSVSAEGAILIDGNTGQVLFGKDIRGEFYPASITKIMTAYLAIIHGWHRTVVVSEAAQNQIGSSAYLVAGEHLPMNKVVTAMMLVSGNDAAYAVAQTVAGSVPAFVAMMNAQARAWGAPGIHFDNPDGLPDPNHVVSALGMAIITEHTMQNPIFAHIVDTKESTLPPDPKPRVYYNQNVLLYNYPNAVGVKIGYTIEADETIVGAARRNGLFLIEVLLHDTPAGLWPDAENLLSWGFAHFQQETLVKAHSRLKPVRIGGRLVPINTKGAVVAAALKSTKTDPTIHIRLNYPNDSRMIRRHKVLGQASVWLGGEEVGSTPIVASVEVKPLPPPISHHWAWLALPAAVLLSLLPRFRHRSHKGRSTQHG